MSKYDGRIKAIEHSLPGEEGRPGVYQKNRDGTYTGPNGEILTEDAFQALKCIKIVDDIPDDTVL